MKECVLYKKEKGKKTRCLVCFHKCLISEGKTGICVVRKNIDGKLYLLVYGKIAAMHIDPIEKKPLYHFLPGSYAYSIGTIGCNLKCGWCQNWEISQERKIFGEEISAEKIVNLAIKSGCKSIAYTYNEPAIFSEFVHDVAILAKKKGLKNILVTNGYYSKEGFNFLMKKKLIDAVNIDLKSFSDKTYKEYCGARLKPVLETIKRAVKNRIHVEITTLIIPDVNDNLDELRKIACFIFNLDKKGNVPWHISRFFPHHKLLGREMTPIKTLKEAYNIGKKVGLKYVHMGNV